MHTERVTPDGKAIVTGSDTTVATQYLLNGSSVEKHNGKQLVATQVPLSRFEIIRQLESCDVGSHGRKSTAMTPRKLAGLFAGQQIHFAAFSFGIYRRMATLFSEGRQPRLSHFYPYQPPKQKDLVDRVFWRENDEDLFLSDEIVSKIFSSRRSQSELPVYFLHAYEGFRTWRLLNYFQDKLPSQWEILYADSGILRPGVREKFWNWEPDDRQRRKRPHPVAARTMAYWYALQLQVLHNRFYDPDPLTTKSLYESPGQVKVILDDGTAAMITWICPDQVVRLVDGQIENRDSKSPSELKHIESYDEYDWLQIMLSNVFAALQANRFFSDTVHATEIPPTYTILFSQLRTLCQLAQTRLVFPEIYDGVTGLPEDRMMLMSDTQIDACLTLFEYLIRKYAIAEYKNQLADYAKHADPEFSGVSPKVILDRVITVQPLLFLQTLSSAFLLDQSQLLDAE